MANDCGFGEFLGVEVEEEDGVELSLGLSIGGSFRKAEKLTPIKQKRVCSSSLNDVKSCEIDADFGEIDRSFCKSDVSSIFNEGKEGNDGVEVLDPQRKKEIHALRRQEARKKREEKRHKKGICNGGRNGGIPMRTGSIDDKMLFEAQMLQIRVRDREVKADEANRCERICKKDRSDNDGSNNEQQNTDMSLKDNKTLNENPDSNPSVFSSSSTFSVVPMHYSYVPFSNGFTYPYVMPCLAPPAAAAIVDNDKNVFQPVACRGFRPFQLQNPNGNWQTSCDLEPNGSNGGGGGGGRVEQAQSSRVSSRSTGSSSSAVSDHQSTSLQGGSSSDSRSHSINDQPQLHASVASNTQGQSEHSASSHPGGSSTQSVEEAAHNADKVVSSNTAQSSATKPEKSISVTEPIPIKKPISTTDNPSSQPTHPLKEAKGDRNKPPRPQPQQQPQTPSLQQMLRVSTTGNGPNGKTITGFLYRYTKTEVSIMCVCHGSSFSPAEFVEHAGGTDISHPLRQIVIRSASG